MVSRLARLERLSTVPRRLRIQYGYLKTLPDDYSGPRHVATVRQLPPGPASEDWFEWEERPGPEPATDARHPNYDLVINVCYVSLSNWSGRKPLSKDSEMNGGRLVAM